MLNMNHHDIDEIFSLLENPTRRRILRLLSLETHYPLQLAHELGISQQAIGKHIRILEDHGFIRSHEEPSDIGGPPRKVYAPTHRFSIRVDMGPGLFQTVYLERMQMEKDSEGNHKKKERSAENETEGVGERVIVGNSGGNVKAKNDIVGNGSRGAVIVGDPRVRQSEENGLLMVSEKIQDTQERDNTGKKVDWKALEMTSGSKNSSDPKLHLKQLSQDLEVLKVELEEMETKRQEMVNRREDLLCAARRIVGELVDDYNERKLVYYLLDRGPASVEDLSETFDSRVKYIQQLRKNIEDSHGIDWLFRD